MRRSNSQRGFSLLELITALSISAVLVGAMAVLIATSATAMERGVDASAMERAAGEAVSDLELDLAEATRLFEQTATSIWFEVPDRNGDGTPEHIRYSWSGVKGDPLMRSTNGGTPGVVANSVHAFGLSLTERPGLKRTESEERLLASFTAHAGAVSTPVQISTTGWAAQTVRPAFTSDVVSWKVTRVRLRARSYGTPDGMFSVALVPLDSSRNPTTPVHATANQRESNLSGWYRWEEFAYAGCPALDPAQPIAIRISGLGGSPVQCELESLVSATPTMPFNTWMLTSADSGATWQAYAQTRNLMYEVYGKVVIEGR